MNEWLNLDFAYSGRACMPAQVIDLLLILRRCLTKAASQANRLYSPGTARWSENTGAALANICPQQRDERTNRLQVRMNLCKRPRSSQQGKPAVQRHLLHYGRQPRTKSFAAWACHGGSACFRGLWYCWPDIRCDHSRLRHKIRLSQLPSQTWLPVSMHSYFMWDLKYLPETGSDLAVSYGQKVYGPNIQLLLSQASVYCSWRTLLTNAQAW